MPTSQQKNTPSTLRHVSGGSTVVGALRSSVHPDHSFPRYEPISFEAAYKNGRLRSLLIFWLALSFALVPTGIATSLLEWTSFPFAVGGAELYISLYLPLVFCVAMTIWFGYLWGAVPAYAAAFLVAQSAGMPLGWALVFAFSHPIGLAIYSMAYRAIPMRTDLRSLAGLLFFLFVAFIASVVSSTGSFILAYTTDVGIEATYSVWQGWWLGGFLQAATLNAPLLILFSSRIHAWKSKSAHLAHDVDTVSKGSLITAFAVVILTILGYVLVVHHFSMLNLARELEIVENGLLKRDIFDAIQGLTLIHWIMITVICVSCVFWYQVVVEWISSVKSNSDELERINTQLEQEVEQRERAERELQAHADALSHANVSKDKFFSIISHDLRSPMGSILSISSFLTDHYEDHEPETAKELLELLHGSAENLFGLVENLLEWARLQTGGMRAEPEDVDLHLIAEAALGLVRRQATEKGLNIENKVPEKTWVSADINMIRSVFLNLLTNAIKFSNESGEIDIYASDYGEKVKVVVRDTGVGMTQSQIGRLFRVDTAFSTRGTNEERGSGLGLIICKEMIEKHGDSIGVSSEPNQGTAFKFTLPAGVDPDRLILSADRPPMEAVSLSSGTVRRAAS